MSKETNNWEKEFEEWFKEAWSWFGGDFRERDKKEWLRQEVKATIRKTRHQTIQEALGEVEYIIVEHPFYPAKIGMSVEKLIAKINQLKKQYDK